MLAIPQVATKEEYSCEGWEARRVGEGRRQEGEGKKVGLPRRSSQSEEWTQLHGWSL